MRKEISKYLEKHGFGMFRPRAVLFDMDGVLYDSMPNHAVAWQESMASFGIHMTAADAYATEGARGIDTIRHFVRAQQGRDIDETEAQQMYDEKTRCFHAMPAPPIMTGIPELMEQIEASGLTIGVVTGSGQRPLIERLLGDFGRYLSRERIVTAYDVSRGKPNPDPYLVGLKKVGNLQPWEAIVVENAPLGVRAGVAARIFTVAVNTGPLPDHCLTDEGANLIFPDMQAFRRQLNSIISPQFISQDERWQLHYQQYVDYIKTRNRLPSKHREEDRALVNWIKYNRKQMNKKQLAEERLEALLQLLKQCNAYRRLNQYTDPIGD